MPIDPVTLEAVGAPLATLEAVSGHFHGRLSDGVGIVAGLQVTGCQVFAVTGGTGALRAWYSDVATGPNERFNAYGSVISTTRSYLRWSAPAVGARSATAFGANADVELAAAMRGDRTAAEARPAWLVWVVAAEDGRQLAVKSRRLADGVHVIGEGGVIPWHAATLDGWELTATGSPIAPSGTPPEWLVQALGAKVRRAS